MHASFALLSANQVHAHGLLSARRAPTVAVSASPVNSAAPKSIVLVDDERSYTDLMTILLADNLDCPVHAFDRPADALAALPTLNPGVIVTDYFMPEIHGLEFIRRAAPLMPGVPFLLITGHPIASLQAEMSQLAALKGYLSKPFSWRTLADEIRRVWPGDASPPSQKADATSF
jgi:DNA-binding NtrC family response regulator